MSNFTPFLDYKQNKNGNRYDYSINFLSENDTKIIYNSLHRELVRLHQHGTTPEENANAQRIQLLLNIIKD